MSQGPLCPNLTQKVQKEVSQMANCNFPRPMLLGGLSVNLNHLKTEWTSESIVFLGMLLNGMQYTISIPYDKLIKALSVIRKLMDRKKAKIIEIQQITGLLNFFHRAIVPGRAFTRRMYDHIKFTNSKG